MNKIHSEERNDHPVRNEVLQVTAARVHKDNFSVTRAKIYSLAFNDDLSGMICFQAGIEAINEFSVDSMIVLKLVSECGSNDVEVVLIGD